MDRTGEDVRLEKGRLIMKGIILAAGRGSRMGDKTKDLPKGLTQLYGKSLIEHQVDKMKNAGIEEVGVVRGYRAEKICFEGLSYFDNLRWSESNMVRSLCCADTWLTKDTCIVSYSDILYEARAVSLLMNCEEDIAITYNTNWLEIWSERFDNPLSDAETFEVSEQGYITEIGGHADNIDQIKGQYMGLLKFSEKGWKQVGEYLADLEEKAIDKLDMTSLLSGMLHKGIRIYGIPYDGLWLEIDSESDLKLYEEKSFC